MANKCIVCGKSLIGGKSNKVFCSDRCRMRKKREDNTPSPEKLAWQDAVERQKTAFEENRIQELDELEIQTFLLRMEKSELEEKIRDPQERIDSLKKEILKDSKRLNEIFTLISLPDVEYYNRFMIDDFRLAKEEIEFGSEEHLRVGAEKGKLISEYSKLEDDLPFKKVRLTRANAATKPTEKEKVQFRKKLDEVISA